MKKELTKEEIEKGLRLMSLSLNRITGTSEIVKEGDEDYCEVTLRIALDNGYTPVETAVGNS